MAWARAGLAPARPPGRRLADRCSSSSRSTRSSPSPSATRTRCPSRSRTGTRSTGTSATCSRRWRTSCTAGSSCTVFVRTFVFVAIALSLSLLIGYPVAYFAARHAGRWKGLVLLLLILPFWINYLMRMLAWINLLAPDGIGTRFSSAIGIERLFISLELLSSRGRLARGPAVHGDHGAHLRLRAVPDPAALRRRSTGSTSGRSRPRAISARARRARSCRVTLPLSCPGSSPALVLIALPMFGDYYTPDLVSASTEDEHDREPDRPAHAAGLGEGRRARR